MNTPNDASDTAINRLFDEFHTCDGRCKHARAMCGSVGKVAPHYICTLPANHSGNHVACAGKYAHGLSMWAQEPRCSHGITLEDNDCRRCMEDAVTL